MIRLHGHLWIAFICLLFIRIIPVAAQEFRILDLNINDICYSPVHDRMYAAIPGNLPHGNSIAVINPSTGETERYIRVGSEPSVVSISDNGRYLYVGLHGAAKIQRFDLINNAFDPYIDLESYAPPPYDSHQPSYAGDIQVLPGDGKSIVVSKVNGLNATPSFLEISVFDGTVERSDKIGGGLIGSTRLVVSENGQNVWGLGHPYKLRAFQRYQINAQGIVEQGEHSDLVDWGAVHVSYQNGRIYLQNGQIFDVSGAGTPTLLETVYIGQDFGNRQAPMTPALDSSRFYVLTDFNPMDPFAFVGYRLGVYDKANFSLKGFYSMPKEFSDQPQKMISLGKGRVAILTGPSSAGPKKLIYFNTAPCIPQNLGLTVTPNLAYPCVGDTLTLDAGSGYPAYYWSNGATGQKIKITAQSAIIDSFRFRVMAPNGCLSQFSPAAQVIFETRPSTVYLQCINNTEIVCPGENVQILPNATDAFAYVFNTGDTILPGQIFKVAEGGVYTAYAISVHGCASIPSLIEVFEAIPNPGLAPTIVASGPLQSCANEMLTLTAPANAYGYYWSSGETTRSIKPQWNGDYAVQTYFENGCNSEWSDTVVVQISASAQQLQIEEAFFVLNIKYINAVADGVQWFINGQAIPGANDLTYTPAQFGIYTVQNLYQNCPSIPSLPYAFTGSFTPNIIAQPNSNPATQYTLIANPFPINDYYYLWSNAATTASITVDAVGEYCLTVTRQEDGLTATQCVTVIPNNRLRASANFNAQLIPGMSIRLYRKDAGQFFEQDTLLTDNNGEVLFENVQPGSYVLQAVPPIGSALANKYLPTYYYNSIFWDQANEVYQLNGLSIANELPPTLNTIYVAPTQTPAGPGSVSGLILEGANENPLEGAGVFLFGSNGTPLLHQFANANGYYYFGGFPYGTYTLCINLLGVTPFCTTIEISPQNPNPDGIHFTLNNGSFTVGTEELSAKQWSVWPNPTTSLVNIELPEAAKLLLYNALGERVGAFQTPMGQSSISLVSYPAGIYWLTAQGEDGRFWQQRLVKH